VADAAAPPAHGGASRGPMRAAPKDAAGSANVRRKGCKGTGGGGDTATRDTDKC
jgi:hypothetical protein